MKYLPLIVVLAALVVHGEEPQAKARKNTDKPASATSQTDSPASPAILVVNQEAATGEQEGHAKKPESYLRTLLSAQNLPNIGLVIVGMGGIAVAICTLLRIENQAIEMRKQRIEMKGQRLVMGRQLEAMREQSERMQKQVDEMSKQTSHLEASVLAAKASAETGKNSLEMFINKERAKLRIEMKPLILPPTPDTAYTVDFAVSIHGPTAAFVTESLCVAYIFPKEVIDDPELGIAVMFPVHPLPVVIPANSPPLDCYAFLALGETVLIPEAKARKLLVGIRGFIKYKDVFGRERITTFRHVWKYAEGLGEGLEYGDWVQRGMPEENQDT